MITDEPDRTPETNPQIRLEYGTSRLAKKAIEIDEVETSPSNSNAESWILLRSKVFDVELENLVLKG
ncbi:hypothetical protein BpHYR1_004806 [Brachionus plicatilis]|uniref:Uncharacterized protein n=1 Tax=Brachionus plicatilis TaxID=10195 RepID=A0A3M7PWN3_BRAPC|nr:hypothetical protein BpHYR1_004806 [Brachionus plicatilis]